MSPLHDRTRRRICLAAFVAICLLPALAILVVSGVRRTSWYVRAEAARWSERWGVKISLDRIEYPRPGVARYLGLVLADPETGDEILRCRRLEAIAAVSDRQGGRKELRLEATEPEVSGSHLGRVAKLIERLLAEPCGDFEAELRLTASSALVRTADGPLVLADVQGKTELQPSWTAAAVRFRLPGQEKGDPGLIRVVRNRQVSPPATGFELDSGGGALACRVLAAALPAMGQFGPRAWFRGNLWVNETPSGWAGQLKGEFDAVDLATVLGDCLPRQLSGVAHVELESARFRQGRVEEICGMVQAGPGSITRSFCEAAGERLRMPAAALPPEAGDPLRYERFQAAFLLNAKGLWLQGRCGAPQSRVLVALDRDHPLLGEPREQPLPLAALAELLAPPGAAPVPLTRQTDWLLRRLPLPADDHVAGGQAAETTGRR
jgi:hypothetical protein